MLATPKRKRNQHRARHPWSAIRFLATLTPKQRLLAKEHGTPDEFARGCYAAVPSFIGMDEAAVAVQKYQTEWDRAGKDAK